MSLGLLAKIKSWSVLQFFFVSQLLWHLIICINFVTFWWKGMFWQGFIVLGHSARSTLFRWPHNLPLTLALLWTCTALNFSNIWSLMYSFLPRPFHCWEWNLRCCTFINWALQEEGIRTYSEWVVNSISSEQLSS